MLEKAKKYFPHIGMRKIKSTIAVLLSFLIWQAIRLVFPLLNVHPLFAYIYSVLEIRDSSEKTKTFGLLRIKSTLLGLAIGLVFLSIMTYLSLLITNSFWNRTVELGLILLGVLLTLLLAEKLNCKTFTGVASIIFVICVIRESNESPYFYAIMRVIQTLLGVFSAWLLNSIIFPYPKREPEQVHND